MEQVGRTLFAGAPGRKHLRREQCEPAAGLPQAADKPLQLLLQQFELIDWRANCVAASAGQRVKGQRNLPPRAPPEAAARAKNKGGLLILHSSALRQRD